MANLLSSDILEQQFGPTGVDILYQAERTRIIATRVLDSRQVLELSLVKFIAAGAEKFAETHQAIMDGASMGKAFRDSHIEFVRHEEAAYSHALPDNFERLFGVKAAATVVEVVVLVGPDQLPYAEILETYSPLVRWPRLHGQPTLAQLNDTIKSFNELLGQVAAR